VRKNQLFSILSVSFPVPSGCRGVDQTRSFVADSCYGSCFDTKSHDQGNPADPEFPEVSISVNLKAGSADEKYPVPMPLSDGDFCEEAYQSGLVEWRMETRPIQPATENRRAKPSGSSEADMEPLIGAPTCQRKLSPVTIFRVIPASRRPPPTPSFSRQNFWLGISQQLNRN